jgi:hypothetical protein
MGIISNGVTVISNGAGSAPTTAQVLTATSSLTHNSVGAYAFLRLDTGSGTVNVYGSGRNGNDLRPTNADGVDMSGNDVGGTWKCLGHTDANSNGRRASLYLRFV